MCIWKDPANYLYLWFQSNGLEFLSVKPLDKLVQQYGERKSWDQQSDSKKELKKIEHASIMEGNS